MYVQVAPRSNRFRLLEMEIAVPDHSSRERFGNLLLQTILKACVNLLHACQELAKRVASAPGDPVYTAPQFIDIVPRSLTDSPAKRRCS